MVLTQSGSPLPPSTLSALSRSSMRTVKDPGECFGVGPRPVTLGRALVADKCPLSIKEGPAWNARKSGVHCVSESDPKWASARDKPRRSAGVSPRVRTAAWRSRIRANCSLSTSCLRRASMSAGTPPSAGPLLRRASFVSGQGPRALVERGPATNTRPARPAVRIWGR